MFLEHDWKASATVTMLKGSRSGLDQDLDGNYLGMLEEAVKDSMMGKDRYINFKQMYMV